MMMTMTQHTAHRSTSNPPTHRSVHTDINHSQNIVTNAPRTAESNNSSTMTKRCTAAFVPCTKDSSNNKGIRTFHPRQYPRPAAAAVHATMTINALPHEWADFAPLSSTQFMIGANTADGVVGSTQVFEAVAPDPSLLIGMGSVVLLCVAAGFVWANDVVPVSRTKLAISKSRGEVREYLDDLRTTSDGTSADNETNATNIANNEQIMGDEKRVELVRPTGDDGRGFERWLFSDWLNKPDSKGGRQKESALPILKDAKWNSGDNPVLVTAAIMMLGVVIASITERIAT